MLSYNRIDSSEGIDVAKSNKNHYWLFNYGFKSQDPICNGCHDLIMLCFNLSDIVIITVKNVDYHCSFYDISKSEVNHLLKNSVLEDRGYI